MAPALRDERLERWERRSDWPLAVAAVVFLVAYAWPILQPHIAPGYHDLCYSVDSFVWLVFIVDYVLRLGIAQHRWNYFQHNLLDLAIITLPILRPLRLLRLIVLLRVLNRRAADSLRGRIAMYVGSATALLVFCASLAVLDAERGAHGSNINSFGNALWWSATTITTVGYGDHYPVTVTGRLVAAGLMIGGIALLGVVTASIASWLIDRVQEVEDSSQAATRADLETLTDELRELKALVAANHLVLTPSPPSNGDG